jgi:uncharacterized lipoprotein YajG
VKKLVLLALAALVLAGCDNPQNTVTTLNKDIARFRATPDDQTQMAIEQSFAKLDRQIADLEKKGKTTEAGTLRSQEATLRADYAAAKIARTVRDAANAIHGIGNAFKEAGQSIGDVFRESTNSAD